MKTKSNMTDNREIKKWTTEQWEDLDLTFRFIDTVWDDEAHGFEFEIYEIIGKDFNEKTKKWDIPIYERKGATNSEDFSLNELEDAQPYLTGLIKWDGCSHFYFGEDGYLHLCGLDRIENLNKVLTKLIELAKLKNVDE